MLARALLLSLLPLLLFSCAKDHEGGEQSGGVYSIAVENLKEAQVISRDAQVACPKSGPCNDSVGLLSFASPDHAAQCTASLVAPDIAVTNSHCIPKDLKEAGTSCRDRIWLHFPPKPGEPSWETTVDCESVLFDSKATGAVTSPDYAYIKLQHASRRPVLRFSREGIAGGEEYHLQKVNPVQSAGNLRGVQESVSCRAVYDSYVLESFFNPLAKVALLTDCLVIPGNSGSPIMGPDGSVHGVIFAFLGLDDVKNRAEADPNVAIQEEPAKLNIASNFACLESPLDAKDANLPTGCATLASDYSRETTLRSEEATRQIDLAVAKEMSASPDFEWGAWYDKDHATGTFGFAGVKLTPYPRCVRADAVARYLDQTMPFARPHWVVKEEYDRVLRGKVGLSLEATTQDEIKVVAGEVNHYYATLSGSGLSFTVELPLCP